MKPCPTCGPLHDLDAVTCTRCGHTEALPDRSPAVQAAMEAARRAMDGDGQARNRLTCEHEPVVRALVAALDGEGT